MAQITPDLQLEEYRRQQRERYLQRPEVIEARRRQEREDEEVARRLQQEEEERLRFVTNTNHSNSSETPMNDEEFARLIQEEMNREEEELPQPPSGLYPSPFPTFPPFPGFRDGIGDDDDDSTFQEPFREHLPPIIPPFFLQRRRGGGLPQRMRFPPQFFPNGRHPIPPEVLQLLRGDMPLDYEATLRLQELMGTANRGASEEIINTIPSRSYEKGSMSEEDAKCGICLADYEIEEVIKTLPHCLHHFHKNCLDKWLGINKICPVCRTDIEGEQPQQ